MAKLDKQTKNKGGNPNWKKGTSGNPNGRPKSGHAISDIIRKLGDKDGQREEVLQIVYDKAKDGDLKAIEFIANYDQGRPVQTVDVIERDPDDVIEIG